MSTVCDAAQLRGGTISKIFPNDDFTITTSIYMHVDGTGIIKFGRQVRTIGKVDRNGDLVKVDGCWPTTISACLAKTREQLRIG